MGIDLGMPVPVCSYVHIGHPASGRWQIVTVGNMVPCPGKSVLETSLLDHLPLNICEMRRRKNTDRYCGVSKVKPCDGNFMDVARIFLMKS